MASVGDRLRDSLADLGFLLLLLLALILLFFHGTPRDELVLERVGVAHEHVIVLLSVDAGAAAPEPPQERQGLRQGDLREEMLLLNQLLRQLHVILVERLQLVVGCGDVVVIGLIAAVQQLSLSIVRQTHIIFL